MLPSSMKSSGDGAQFARRWLAGGMATSDSSDIIPRPLIPSPNPTTPNHGKYLAPRLWTEIPDDAPRDLLEAWFGSGRVVGAWGLGLGFRLEVWGLRFGSGSCFRLGVRVQGLRFVV